MTRIHAHDLAIVVAFVVLGPVSLLTMSVPLMLLAGALGLMATASGLVEG
jgi:hypothetical protein